MMRQIELIYTVRQGEVINWPEMIWPDPVGEPVMMTMEQIADSPWPLVKLEERPEYGGWLCARKDVRYWRLTAARFAVRRWFEMIQHRTIETLVIWNLVKPGEGMDWRGWKNVGKGGRNG